MRVLLDARRSGHDIGGQVQHALERVGCYGGHRRSPVFGSISWQKQT
jgi:hypothetical protein